MTEITPAMIYWIMRLDGICETAKILLTISMIATVAFFAILTAFIVDFGPEPDEEEERFIKKAKKCFKISSLFTIVLLVIAMFVPTTKEMCAIVTIPKVVNSEIVTEQIPDATKNLLSLANQYLESLLKEGGEE